MLDDGRDIQTGLGMSSLLRRRVLAAAAALVTVGGCGATAPAKPVTTDRTTTAVASRLSPPGTKRAGLELSRAIAHALYAAGRGRREVTELNMARVAASDRWTRIDIIPGPKTPGDNAYWLGKAGIRISHPPGTAGDDTRIVLSDNGVVRLAILMSTPSFAFQCIGGPLSRRHPVLDLLKGQRMTRQSYAVAVVDHHGYKSYTIVECLLSLVVPPSVASRYGGTSLKPGVVKGGPGDKRSARPNEG